MSEPFIGEIRLFAGNYAPEGWFLCNGELKSIMEYQALYSLLYTTYGGDGRTTFGVPDLRDRAALGAGGGPGLTYRKLGMTGGYASVALNQDRMPQHTHEITDKSITTSMTVSTQNGSINVPETGNYLAVSYGDETRKNVSWYSKSTENLSDLGGVKSQCNPSMSEVGGGVAHKNIQPSLGVQFIIAWQGLYPSRS